MAGGHRGSYPRTLKKRCVTQHHITPGIHPLYTLYTPFIHPRCRICTYVHPLYMHITPYIHLTRTSKHPVYTQITPYTPHIHPKYTTTPLRTHYIVGTPPHHSTGVAVLGAAVEGGRQGDRGCDQWRTGGATKQLLVRSRVNHVLIKGNRLIE